MGHFTNQVVWITGASSGIGEALAKQFAHEGAKLVLSARREAELRRVKTEMQVPNEHVMVLPMDMLNSADFDAKVAEVLRRFGQIDVVVQNAGISQRSLIKDTDFQVYRDIMELDFFSVVALTKAILPHMTARQSGHFVAISSVAGKIGTPLRSGYCAAKHALIGFMDSLRAETWRDNVHVTVVCPGYIRTSISLNALDAQGQKHGKMDDNQAKGMPAEACAQRIVRAVRSRQNEVYIGGAFEVLGIYLKRWIPGIVYNMVKKLNA